MGNNARPLKLSVAQQLGSTLPRLDSLHLKRPRLRPTSVQSAAVMPSAS
jgi:hypothetical protein